MRNLLFCLIVACLILTPACQDQGLKYDVRVVTTIGMIGDIVKNIGGEHVDVYSLMGPGVDPHLYRASEGDVSRLSKANVIFYGGLHLEAKMGEILEKMSSRKKTVAVSEAIPAEKLISSKAYEGLPDPHVWFDVSLWVLGAERVRDTLIEMDPDHKEAIKANADRYIQSLRQLHTEVSKETQKIPKDQRVLVTAHDAFNYFGRAYGFEVKGLQGISTQSVAGTKDIQNLAKFIVDRKIRAIFVESSVPRQNIQAVQEAVSAMGWRVEIGGELFSDAMGPEGTPEGTYEGMVRHNVKAIVSGLKAK